MLAEIWCYPVKSCGGVSLTRAAVGHRGIRFDRHWMLVDGAGRFVTQRQFPRLALVRPRFDTGALTLEAPAQEPLRVPYTQEPDCSIRVQIWRDQCEAAAVGDRADRWFTGFLGTPVRLVFLPPGSRRQVDPRYAEASDEVAFADGFPFLLIGRSSLEDLAQRMGTDPGLRRFRPNLVVAGAAPYAEDGWRKLRIGGLGFRVVKPCSRCAVTTVNPDTGVRDLDTLGVLAAYRRRNNQVFFGQNLVHDGTGELCVGQAVAVVA